MSCWRILFLFLSALVICINQVYASDMAQNPYPFLSIADTKRFESLTKEIRCVVCQNQNIAESTAPLANDLREKVYRMVIDKKSNTEIKNYLVKRYGEYILLQPRMNNTTFILWAFPFLAICAALLFLHRVFLHQAKVHFKKEIF
jgi:cytochrome c-type biogenesis protein CcmH